MFWLQPSPSAQLSILLLLSFAELVYLAFEKPLSSKVDSFLALINTFFLILLYCWGLAIMGSDTLKFSRSTFGLVLIYAVIMITLLNLLTIFLSFLHKCFTN